MYSFICSFMGGVHICVQMCASQGTYVEILAQLAGSFLSFCHMDPRHKVFPFLPTPKVQLWLPLLLGRASGQK